MILAGILFQIFLILGVEELMMERVVHFTADDNNKAGCNVVSPISRATGYFHTAASVGLRVTLGLETDVISVVVVVVRVFIINHTTLLSL